MKAARPKSQTKKLEIAVQDIYDDIAEARAEKDEMRLSELYRKLANTRKNAP